jgi:hypothetical protein
MGSAGMTTMGVAGITDGISAPTPGIMATGRGSTSAPVRGR